MDKVYDFLIGFGWAGDLIKVAATFLVTGIMAFMAVRIAWRKHCYSPLAVVLVYVTSVATNIFRAMNSDAIRYAGVERTAVSVLEAVVLVGWGVVLYFFWQERWTLQIERRSKVVEDDDGAGELV